MTQPNFGTLHDQAYGRHPYSHDASSNSKTCDSTRQGPVKTFLAMQGAAAGAAARGRHASGKQQSSSQRTHYARGSGSSSSSQGHAPE